MTTNCSFSGPKLPKTVMSMIEESKLPPSASLDPLKANLATLIRNDPNSSITFGVNTMIIHIASNCLERGSLQSQVPQNWSVREVQPSAPDEKMQFIITMVDPDPINR